MSRLKLLLAQPQAALGALLTVALAATAIVGSGADFTASSASPGNTFSAGTLHIVNSKDGVAVFSGTNLLPGGAATVGTVDILNDGSLAGAFQVSRSALADSDGTNPLSGKIDLTVVDCGAFTGSTPPTCGDGDDVQRYSGTLAAMSPVALGQFAAGEQHRFKFSASLDGSAGNAYQGGDTSVRFDFDAA